MLLGHISQFNPVGGLWEMYSAIAYTNGPADVRVALVIVEMSGSITEDASVSFGIF